MSRYDGPWRAKQPSPGAGERLAERLAAPASEQAAIRAKQDRESISVAPGESTYHCTRGNCNTVLAGPHEQDDHNHAHHLGGRMQLGGPDDPGEGNDPVTGIARND